MPRVWHSADLAPTLPKKTEPRSVIQQKISAYFHGTSILSAEKITQHRRNHKTVRPGSRQRPHIQLDTSHLATSAPVLRSPTSTRSLIDSSSFPTNSVRPALSATFQQAHLPLQSSRAGVTTEESQLGALSSLAQHQDRSRAIWRRNKDRTCASLMKDRAIRHRIMSCLISGGVLAIIVIIYLALAISNSVAGQEFHVILILFILVTTVFFCHTLIRLCMLASRPSKGRQQERVPSRAAIGGFAQPQRPIPVVLARDEELGINGHQAEMAKEVSPLPPPPAYGLWRGSVRVDPNLLHWQRTGNPRSPVAEESPHDSHESVIRPPSYIINDGLEIREADSSNTDHLVLRSISSLGRESG